MGADADRMALRYIEENVFGVTPDGNATGLTLTTTQSSKKYAAASGLDVFYSNQTVIIAGLANAASNGYKTVVSATATELVVEEAIGADEAAVGSCSILTAYKSTRFTSEGLEQSTDTVESSEIRPDRQVSCMKRTSVSAGGPINVELSYGTYDDFIEAALMGAWSTLKTDTQATFAAVVNDNRITDSTDGLVAVGYLANQWVKTSGFALAANNGYSKITRVVAAGTLNDLAPVVKDQIEIGDTTCILDKGTLTGTLKIGNTFVIAGNSQIYVLTADATAASNEIALSFSPASVAIYAAEAVATVEMNEALILSHKTLAAEAEGEDVTITMGAQVVNGVTERSFSMEKEFGDVGKLHPFSGMAIDGFSLDVTVANLITGIFATMGKRQLAGADASTGDGTPQPSTSVCPMNAVDEVLALFEDGSSREASAFSPALINNARARQIIGTLGPDSLGYGRVGVTGGLTVYFENEVTHDKYLNFDDLSLAIVFVDNDGNAYVMDLPKLNFTAGPVVAGGAGTDVVADMSWTATRHVTEDVTIRIARFAA